jgi:hypothetical protein
MSGAKDLTSRARLAILLASTMLSGIAGATLIGSGRTEAADLVVKAPFDASLPAVDGVNGKIEVYGGEINQDSVFAVGGSLSAPLPNRQWGLQIDASAGSLDSAAFATVAPHLFYRNPERGLFGFYGSYTNWDQLGGVYLVQLSGEGEYYFGRFTVQGVAGVEFGNTINACCSTAPAGGPFSAPGFSVTGTLFDGHSRFFDQVNLKYYITDDWSAYIGHRYLGERNAFAGGSEFAMPFGGGTMASLFVEGRIGESNYTGIWGGVKFYFGNRDKTLIRRQREDDPNTWDTLQSILNERGSSTSTPFCTPPRVLLPSGRCELIPS